MPLVCTQDSQNLKVSTVVQTERDLGVNLPFLLKEQKKKLLKFKTYGENFHVFVFSHVVVVAILSWLSPEAILPKRGRRGRVVALKVASKIKARTIRKGRLYLWLVQLQWCGTKPLFLFPVSWLGDPPVPGLRIIKKSPGKQKELKRQKKRKRSGNWPHKIVYELRAHPLSIHVWIWPSLVCQRLWKLN